MTPYLILHKVRGEPAFDIAVLCEDMGSPLDPGPWWIIPTSGHRAKPFRQWPLEEALMIDHRTIPDDWPDHFEYEYNNDKITGPISPDLSSIAAALLKPIEPLRRRF